MNEDRKSPANPQKIIFLVADYPNSCVLAIMFSMKLNSFHKYRVLIHVSDTYLGKIRTKERFLLEAGLKPKKK